MKWSAASTSIIVAMVQSFRKRIRLFLNSFGRYFHPGRGITADLLIIGLFGLLSVSWFRGDNLIAAMDFSMPLDRIRSFSANFYMWDLRSLGNANPRILALTVPLWAFFAFSEIVSLSLVNTEKLLFYFVFTLSGLSMYYLTTTLLSYKTFKFKRLAGLISGIFYMLNPYVAISIMPLRQVSVIIYALLPLFLGIFVKGLNEKKNLRFVIMAAFITLLATSAYVDPSYIPLTFLPLFIYLIFFILTNPKRTAIFSAFKFTTVLIVLWALLNSYWLIPDVYSAPNELAKVARAYASVGASFQSNVELNSAPILGAIRLLGYWGLDSGYKGDPYFTWASTYKNPFLIAIGFLVPFLAFAPLLLKPKDKHVVFFTSFAVISLLLINGSYSPLGNWIYSNIPLFGTLFNTPYLRFGMYLTLAYAFLISYALAKILNHLTSHLKRTRYLPRQIVSGFPIVLILFLITGVYAFPLWTGDVIRPSTQVIQSNRYQMPTYYQAASDWLGTDASDFKIIVLPASKLGYAAFKWENGGYEGPYPAEWLFPTPVVSSTLAGDGLAGLAAKLIINNSTAVASKILALMGVKYVLFHEDTDWLYIDDNPSWISTPPEQLRSILSSSDALSLEKTFDKLYFYRNNYWNSTYIHAATQSILINDFDQLIQVAERDDFNPENSVLVLSNQFNSLQAGENFTTANALLSANNTSTAYEKINPTKYTVHINTSQAFSLVFSESYDKDWTAYIDGQQISDEYHFTANGYANGWYVNKTGTYTITLEFWPQKLFYIGSAISIGTLVLCILYVSKDKIKIIYRQYIKNSPNQKQNSGSIQ